MRVRAVPVPAAAVSLPLLAVGAVVTLFVRPLDDHAEPHVESSSER